MSAIITNGKKQTSKYTDLILHEARILHAIQDVLTALAAGDLDSSDSETPAPSPGNDRGNSPGLNRIYPRTPSIETDISKIQVVPESYFH